MTQERVLINNSIFTLKVKIYSTTLASLIFFKARVNYSVVCSIVILANTVRRCERYMAPHLERIHDVTYPHNPHPRPYRTWHSPGKGRECLEMRLITLNCPQLCRDEANHFKLPTPL